MYKFGYYLNNIKHYFLYPFQRSTFHLVILISLPYDVFIQFQYNFLIENTNAF